MFRYWFGVERHIVWPDGRREIQGVTPKQLPAPAPASHALPIDETIAPHRNDFNKLED